MSNPQVIEVFTVPYRPPTRSPPEEPLRVGKVCVSPSLLMRLVRGFTLLLHLSLSLLCSTLLYYLIYQSLRLKILFFNISFSFPFFELSSSFLFVYLWMARKKDGAVKLSFFFYISLFQCCEQTESIKYSRNIECLKN